MSATAKKTTSERKPASRAKAMKPAASGATIYGHKLDVIAKMVTDYLRVTGPASRPTISLAVFAHQKAPRWTKELNNAERFRVIRKVLSALEKNGTVSERLSKSKHGNTAHMYRLNK